MPLILAIEPDRRQAARVAALARKHLEAEIVVVNSVDAALEQLKTARPDLVLTPLLMSARDDKALTRRLRELDQDGLELQTLVIPVLAAGPNEAADDEGGGGLLKRLRKPKTAQSAPTACAPEIFAGQIDEYLTRIAADRHDREHTTRASLWAETRSAASAPMLGELLTVPAAEQPAPSPLFGSAAHDHIEVGTPFMSGAPEAAPLHDGPHVAHEEATVAEPAHDVVSFLRSSDPLDQGLDSASVDRSLIRNVGSSDPTTEDGSLARSLWSSPRRHEEPEPVSIVRPPDDVRPDVASSAFAEAPADRRSPGGGWSQPANDDRELALRHDVPEPVSAGGSEGPSLHELPTVHDRQGDDVVRRALSIDPTIDDRSLVRSFWSPAHQPEAPEPVSIVRPPDAVVVRSVGSVDPTSHDHDLAFGREVPEPVSLGRSEDPPLHELPTNHHNDLVHRHQEPEPVSTAGPEIPPAQDQHADDLGRRPSGDATTDHRSLVRTFWSSLRRHEQPEHVSIVRPLDDVVRSVGSSDSTSHDHELAFGRAVPEPVSMAGSADPPVHELPTNHHNDLVHRHQEPEPPVSTAGPEIPPAHDQHTDDLGRRPSSGDATTEHRSLVRSFWSSLRRHEQPEHVSIVRPPDDVVRSVGSSDPTSHHDFAVGHAVPERVSTGGSEDPPLHELPANHDDELAREHAVPEPVPMGASEDPPLHEAEPANTELADVAAWAEEPTLHGRSAHAEETTESEPPHREPLPTEAEPGDADQAAVWEDLESFLADIELETAEAKPQPASSPVEEPAVVEEPSSDELWATWETLESPPQQPIERLERPRPKKHAPAPVKASRVARAPKAKEAKKSKSPRPRAKKEPKRPMQDEWGLYDPEQCGFAALLERLEEITEAESHD